MQLRSSIPVGLALLTLPALPLSAQISAQTPVPAAAASPLTAARTIQVHETLSRAGSDGTLPPPCSVDVRIQRPDKVKVVISYPNSARVDQYVQDGRTEYQFDGAAKKYLVTSIPPAGEASAQIRGITLLNILLSGGQMPPVPNAAMTTAADSVNGRRMTLVTQIEDPKSAADPTLKAKIQFWTDSQTRLPYRFLVSLTQKGVTKTYEDVTFSNWALDKPIPAAQLAWIPPAGAQPLQSDADKLLSPGTPAPDFAAVAPDGRIVHLSDYKGKVVVLDFWATWCGPCQHSMPHLEKVYQQVKDKNVAVLAVCAWDQKAAYDQWVKAKSGAYTFQTAFDPAGHADKNIAGSLYHVSGIPTQYVIDKNGAVAAAYTGYADNDTRLESALAGQGIALPAASKADAKANAKAAQN